MFERPQQGERALLVHLKFRDPRQTASLQEFRELAKTAGAELIESVVCRRDLPDPKYLIGKGKLTEIQATIEAEKIELVLFNHALTPSQERNLEKFFKCRVVDRTGLILDIFAQHARTFEGKLQVELAQLRHLSTRLIRGWTHLERQKGGIGLRGPGETQLEVDRRLIRQRIKSIAKRLEKVRSQRSISRRARKRAQIPTVSLVGYTNSGKSTLFNYLTKSEVYAADQLFATLDPTLRIVPLKRIKKVILADTVGFIRDLPHDLIDAFRATLEETLEADLLLHVIDCSDELWQARAKQVEGVLGQIGALNVPILEVYNKIDLQKLLTPGPQYDHHGIVTRVNISAKTGEGIAALKDAIAARLCHDVVEGMLVLKPTYARVRAYLYEVGAIDKEILLEDGSWQLNITLLSTTWDTLCRENSVLPGCFKQQPL